MNVFSINEELEEFRFENNYCDSSLYPYVYFRSFICFVGSPFEMDFSLF